MTTDNAREAGLEAEVRALRDLLAAINEATTVPPAADPGDYRYLMAIENRLGIIQIWGEVGPELRAPYIGSLARRLRDLTRPVGYAVRESQ